MRSAHDVRRSPVVITGGRRRARVGMLVASFAVMALGCQSADSASNAATSPPAAASTVAPTLAPSTAAGTAAPTEAPATQAPIDAPAVLQSALDALAGGYHFDSHVTIGDKEVVVAAGDRVGDGTRLTIWADGGSVAYVITPLASYVFPEGGEWQPLDAAPSTTDPIIALRTPTSVTGVAGDGGSVVLTVTVPGVSLGVAGAGDVPVTVTVVGGAAVEVRYDTTVNGSAASVVTNLGPVVDGSPVVAPI